MINKTFKTSQTDLTKYNRQTVEIIRVIKKGEGGVGYDDECLPMVKIKFNDGFETDAYPDELE